MPLPRYVTDSLSSFVKVMQVGEFAGVPAASNTEVLKFGPSDAPMTVRTSTSRLRIATGPAALRGTGWSLSPVTVTVTAPATAGATATTPSAAAVAANVLVVLRPLLNASDLPLEGAAHPG